MTTASVYFFAQLVLMGPLVLVHYLCIRVTALRPFIMPDNGQRWRYQWAEGAMGIACLAMLFYMWTVLPIMVAFCATQPVLGFIAHMPWIVMTGVVLITKLRHLGRLREQATAA